MKAFCGQKRRKVMTDLKQDNRTVFYFAKWCSLVTRGIHFCPVSKRLCLRKFQLNILKKITTTVTNCRISTSRQLWCLSSRRAGMIIWGMTGLLAWPQCQIILSAITRHVQDKRGQAQPAWVNEGQGPAWPTWSPSMATWPTEWMRGRLWMLSTWILVKPLTGFPTASFWRKGLLMAWTGALFAG